MEKDAPSASATCANFSQLCKFLVFSRILLKIFAFCCAILGIFDYLHDLKHFLTFFLCYLFRLEVLSVLFCKLFPSLYIGISQFFWQNWLPANINYSNSYTWYIKLSYCAKWHPRNYYLLWPSAYKPTFCADTKSIVNFALRRRGIFGFQPGIFPVTQLMNYENILFSNLDRTFQKQFCDSSPNQFF